MVELLLANVSYLLVYATVLCVVVSIGIEFLKETPLDKYIPTRLLVLFLHVFLNTLALFVVAEYFALPVLWYYIVGVILASLITAKANIDGFDSVGELWIKFKTNK